MKQAEPLSFIEQALLRQTTGYTLLSMVSEAAEDAISRARSSWSGSTTTLKGRRGWSQTGAKGVGWSEGMGVSHSSEPSDYEVFVTWVRIRAHVSSVLTTALVRDVKAWAVRDQKHRITHRIYPSYDTHPKGYARVDKWYKEVHRPKGRALEAERKELIDRILPSLIDWEEESESLPSDLKEVRSEPLPSD